MKMQAFDVYKTYLGIKAHFTQPSYDYLKYGNVNAKYETFARRNDRFFFEKLGKKYSDEDIRNVFVSNFLANKNSWIGDFFDEDVESVYKDWKRRQESLTYIFNQEIDMLFEYLEDNNLKFDDLFALKTDQYPIIFQMLLQNKICPETYSILDAMLGFGEVFEKKYGKDSLWKNLSLRFRKYRGFMVGQAKKPEVKKSVVDRLRQHKLA